MVGLDFDPNSSLIKATLSPPIPAKVTILFHILVVQSFTFSRTTCIGPNEFSTIYFGFYKMGY